MDVVRCSSSKLVYRLEATAFIVSVVVVIGRPEVAAAGAVRVVAGAPRGPTDGSAAPLLTSPVVAAHAPHGAHIGAIGSIVAVAAVAASLLVTHVAAHAICVAATAHRIPHTIPVPTLSAETTRLLVLLGVNREQHIGNTTKLRFTRSLAATR